MINLVWGFLCIMWKEKLPIFFGHLSMDSERVLINFDNFLIIIEKYEKMYKGENIMVNPVTVMKMLNERKKFMANHPHFFDFFVNAFGKGVGENTEIELSIKHPGEESTSSKITIKKSDLKLFQELQELIN